MKNRKLRKLAAAAVVLAVLVMLFSGCAETPEPAPTEAPAALQQTAAPSPELPVVAPDEPAEWTVYWYMCGSNLESFYGCASSDLAEAMSVELPGSVRLVIETGGSYEWHNDQVSAGAIQRFVLDKNGMQLIEELPDANMGEKETLASFLSFCKDNYPSEHTMVLFWNHGGGSVAGAAFDETHGYDSLTLREFADAFASVYPDTGTAPIDIVGFDTCLMSTVDVAETFRPYAKYMVASEELEPGCGWYYTGWLGALAEDPSSDAERVGRAICDTYAEECAARGCGYEITLALTDLGKLGVLTESYNALGNEALISAISDPGFFALFGRSARVTENYGGNTREQGYTNMVDLGALVRNCESLFPGTAADVLSAIDEAVIYRVNGEYRAEATGLSCYYSYNADLSDFADYTLVGASEAFKYLYAYGLTGQLSDAGMQYVSALGIVTAENKTAPTAYGGACAGYLPLTADRPVSGRSYVSAMPYLGGAAASLLTVDYYYEPSLGVWIDPDTGSVLPYDPYSEAKNPTPSGPNELDEFWRQQQEMKEARQKAEAEARLEAERLEAERLEAERLEAERLEAERQEAERKAREEQERLAAWQRYLAEQQALEEAENTEGEEQEGLLAPVPTLDDFDGEKVMWVEISDEGYPVLKTEPELARTLSAIRVIVRQLEASADTTSARVDLVDWGQSDLISTDWRSGTAYSWFSGYWAAIGGSALHTEICYSSDDYTLISAPILLNGEPCNLHIAFSRKVTQLPGGATQTDMEWHILGARKGLDPVSGMADKYLIELRPGDEIIPVYYVRQDITDPDSEFIYRAQEENAVIYEDEDQLDLMADFGNAVYELRFEVVDTRNRTRLSEPVFVQVSGDTVYTQLWNEYMADLDTGVERYR